MATIDREFTVSTSPEAAWDAIRDVGALHARLARGFVTDTRSACRAAGGRAAHHNASLQVLSQPGGVAAMQRTLEGAKAP
jgi:hypothetical protein